MPHQPALPLADWPAGFRHLPGHLPEAAQRALRCPVCHARLGVSAAQLECPNPEHRFPIVGGIPVVLNEAASIFSIVAL